MKKLEYEKIITTNEFVNGIEDKDILATIANIESNKLQKENYIKENFYLRAREVSNTGVYSNYTVVEKEALAINIMYDNADFINFLLELNIPFSKAEEICKTIATFKHINEINPRDLLFESDNYKMVLKLIHSIYDLFQKRFGSQDIYLTINKLMYIVAFEQELYLKLQQQKIIKPQF